MAVRAVQVVVSGRVQGVGFRWSTLTEAEALGLTGWVRNRNDGSVEVWAEGEDAAVAQLIDWLGAGPGYARVHRCQVTERSPEGYRDFQVSGGGW